MWAALPRRTVGAAAPLCVYVRGVAFVVHSRWVGTPLAPPRALAAADSLVGGVSLTASTQGDGWDCALEALVSFLFAAGGEGAKRPHQTEALPTSEVPAVWQEGELSTVIQHGALSDSPWDGRSDPARCGLATACRSCTRPRTTGAPRDRGAVRPTRFHGVQVDGRADTEDMLAIVENTGFSPTP